jgi:hypothetical protein
MPQAPLFVANIKLGFGERFGYTFGDVVPEPPSEREPYKSIDKPKIYVQISQV